MPAGETVATATPARPASELGQFAAAGPCRVGFAVERTVFTPK